MATRYNINDFGLANPAYVGATVSFWTVSGGAKTATLATLYAASTGSTTLSNPRTLDSDGKFSVPVYAEVPVIATVSGLTVADHDTGIMGLAEGSAATSAAAALASQSAAGVSAAAAVVSASAAGVSAAAALVSENNAAATLAAALPKAGGTMTGGINSARGNITQHATTMDFFAVTSPDILDGTGSAVTITACTNAPQAGATRKFYPIVATVLTHGATFDIAGNANLTAAAGDCWAIEAKTASTYRVTAVKKDGTAVVGFSASAVAGLGNGRATDITISSAGEVTMPLQPAFLAYNSATDSNVTGDDTSYTVVCDTEVFDQNGDYNNGTGVFTAPVTGRYRLTARALVAELASAHVAQEINLTTSNRLYSVQDIFGSNPYTQRQLEINVLADMDAGDTASFAVVMRSGTKVCDVYGSAIGNYTIFAGELVA